MGVFFLHSSVLHFSHLYCSWLISLFKTASKASEEVLSSVPKSEKVGCDLRRKRVLGKLCPGMRYSATGCEFSASESTIYIT